jgi:hypothetical protein
MTDFSNIITHLQSLNPHQTKIPPKLSIIWEEFGVKAC